MLDFAETLKIFVPAVIVPLCAFVGNWIYRGHNDYNLTGASDFLLALIVFDIAVISTAKDFEPFVKDESLRTAVIQWHIAATSITGVLWLAIIRYAEPKLADYYKSSRRKKLEFPYSHFLLPWSLSFIIVLVQTLFFLLK